jgi:sulfite exporter TauE/SafE
VDHHQHGHIEHLLMNGNIFDIATLIAVVWFSFVMSWHCGIMCGPLVCSRMLSSKKSNWIDVVLYNVGRLLSYSLMGAVVGAAVSGLKTGLEGFLPSFGMYLSFLMAIVLALQGILLVSNRKFRDFLTALNLFSVNTEKASELNLLSYSKINLKIFSNIDSMFEGKIRSFVFGVFTVFLPCMTLTSAITAAALGESALAGAAILFGFCIGTWPVMVVLPLYGSKFGKTAFSIRNSARVRIVGGILLLITSIITVLRVFH